MPDIKILAIETSCDETSAAVVVNGRKVLSNVISSQIKTHMLFGGVVPEIASRQHIQAIDVVIQQALEEAKTKKEDLDAIAVTYGPGLVGALLVGLSEAKALSLALNKPLVPVHHIRGHIAANYIQDPSWEPPFICLIVSGGHTHLVHIKDYDDFEILGRTRDDAAGEAFDKVARVLGIPYPGGPGIDKLSLEGDPEAIEFPRAYLEEGSYDFSFSGLKSAVLNYINKAKMKNEPINNADIAASFQKAVTDILTERAERACKQTGIKKLALAGGVSANKHLRAQIEAMCKRENITFSVPDIILCTDNAAMIGSAAYYEYLKGNIADMSVNAYPSLGLEESMF
ncbi:MAG: tRNA (adenosine(37)-N6)-threonylcarbamoyltransferase complex transferase subunit TsaD [Firmicutes bacterium]|nr:tRNA (adenosine(37)-N6)-threonylcarbamoyltransferase complex transferase subunit TsaD [Bacillota bacterium]